MTVIAGHRDSRPVLGHRCRKPGQLRAGEPRSRIVERMTGLVVIFAVAVALQTGCSSDARAAADTLPLVDGPKRCAAAPRQRGMWQDLADDDVCRVVAFGRVPGAAPSMFYQLQAYLAPNTAGPEGAGAVLLLPSPDGRTLMTLGGWSGSGATVERPRIVRTRQGRILVLPMSATVSSHPTDDVVLRVVGRRWVQVSTHDWWEGVHNPSGAEQRNGNAMDWPTLRAYGAFWRQADSECCPTGGSYVARLRLDGTRLRLAAIRYSRGDLPFP